jgi:hypothetical protein
MEINKIKVQFMGCRDEEAVDKVRRNVAAQVEQRGGFKAS